jgi:hypothetical protein
MNRVTLGGWVAALTILATLPAHAQYVCFPSCAPQSQGTVDGKFLSLAGSALATFDSDAVTVVFGLPATATDVEFGIFDGNTTGQWESAAGTINLTYTLFEDPLASGTGPVQVAQWVETDFPDNAWLDLAVPVGPGALAPSGTAYFYRLRIEATNAQPLAWTNFKVRTPDSNSLSLKPQAFNFTGARFTAADLAVIYPAFPALTPTRYDGHWQFFARIGASTDTAEFWDGDLDRGSATCTDNDSDDPDTPGAPFLPPWAAGTAAFEGIAVGEPRPCGTTTGSPPDDVDFASFLRAPAVTYSVTVPGDPTPYLNDNPSGNLEWERFTLSTIPGSVPATADHVVPNLPAGVYLLDMQGMDMRNFNSWFIPFEILGVCEQAGGETPELCAPDFSPFRVGDFVWRDTDGDGFQDGGEAGISGVAVCLLDTNGQRIADAGPFGNGCTTTDANGLYSFDVEAGTYRVRIEASNFGPGGALQGLVSTTGGEILARTVETDNVLTYDFGYRGAGSLGDRVWLDADGDGFQDAGEIGLNGVTVRLEKPGGALVATAVTAGDGLYGFQHLDPGAYEVEIDVSTLPAGYTQTFDLDGLGTASLAAAPLAAGQARVDVDFGYTPPCLPGTYFDNFGSASFANSNGSLAWAGSWEENDVAGAGPSAGNVQVHSGLLTLQDAPDTGTEPSVARTANLLGAGSATLSFTVLTSSGVDTDDAVVVEISRDGGATYTVLETFTGIRGAVTLPRSYNITGYVAAQTKVRFRVKTFYGVNDEQFCVDNFKITTSCPGACTVATYLDSFGRVSFANNSGSAGFSGPWQEYDVAGAGPSAGNVEVHNGLLTLQDSPDTGTQPSAAREVDLSGALGATLSFTYLTSSGVDTDDAVVVEVSRDGGATYTVLETFTGIRGAVTVNRSYDLGAYLSSQTRVRFRVKSFYGVSDELFCVDNLKITTRC